MHVDLLGLKKYLCTLKFHINEKIKKSELSEFSHSLCMNSIGLQAWDEYKQNCI